MLAIANKYAMAEEEHQRPEEGQRAGPLDQYNTSKNNDKKMKADHFIANVERLCHNKEY
jgi:hypothetical protein